MDLQKDDDKPKETNGKFGPTQTKKARDLADDAEHSH